MMVSKVEDMWWVTTCLRCKTHLEDKDARAFAHDEASPVFIKRPARLGRLIIPPGRQTPRSCEPGDREGMHAGFGGTRDHDIGFACCDEAGGVSDGVGTGRTGGRGC